MKTNLLLIIYLIFSLQGCQGQEDTKQLTDITSLQQAQGKSDAGISFSGPPDFRYAAKKATPGVVYAKGKYQPAKREKDQKKEEDFHGIPDPFRNFFKIDPFFKQFKFRKEVIKGLLNPCQDHSVIPAIQLRALVTICIVCE